MTHFSEIYLIAISVIVSGLWLWVAWKDNGKFDKKEIVQLFLIYGSVYVFYEFERFGLGGLAIVLGSLIISTGMKVFKLLANGKEQQAN